MSLCLNESAESGLWEGREIVKWRKVWYSVKREFLNYAGFNK